MYGTPIPRSPHGVVDSRVVLGTIVQTNIATDGRHPGCPRPYTTNIATDGATDAGSCSVYGDERGDQPNTVVV